MQFPGAAAPGPGASSAVAVVDRASTTVTPGRSLPVPSTTMRSPACRPSTISAWPAWRAPARTGAWATLPSASTRYTNESRPTCTTAISGTTSAWRSGRYRRTSSSMPGRSRLWSLSNTARTVTARVFGSIRASVVCTWPVNSRPGQAALVAVTRAPGTIADSEDSGTWKSTYMCEMSSRVAMVAFGVSSAPGLTWRMPSTPANGARTWRSLMSERICRTRAAATSRSARCASRVERATSFCPASPSSRRYCSSASARVASASPSAASCASTRRVTSGCPACTCCPLSKCTWSTISLTLAVRVTDSRAWAVPSARTVSLQATGCTTVVVTWMSLAAGAAAPPCLPPQPARPMAATASSRPATRENDDIDRLAGFMYAKLQVYRPAGTPGCAFG